MHLRQLLRLQGAACYLNKLLQAHWRIFCFFKFTLVSSIERRASAATSPVAGRCMLSKQNLAGALAYPLFLVYFGI